MIGGDLVFSLHWCRSAGLLDVPAVPVIGDDLDGPWAARSATKAAAVSSSPTWVVRSSVLRGAREANDVAGGLMSEEQYSA